jgi:mycofactocin precursor peptide peptidase
VTDAMERRTTTEQQSLGRRTLLVPLGACEQHGPHLPLVTDTLIAVTVCRDVAEHRDVDIAPAMPFGASGEHKGFAGLLSLGTDVTSAALTELVRSARASWSRIVIVSGHGGNADALARTKSVATREGDDVRIWLARDRDGDAHAGGSETSVMLAIDPALVRSDQIPRAVPLADGWYDVAVRDGVRAVSANGVLGDPATATAERGWALRAAWCAEVVAMVDATSVT